MVGKREAVGGVGGVVSESCFKPLSAAVVSVPCRVSSKVREGERKDRVRN